MAVYHLDCAQLKKEAPNLRAGDRVLLSGTAYTARDAAHQRIAQALDARGYTYDVTPGVSSFCGAAAALKAEYTLPNVSQTVIITRAEGRTPVPEKEQLRALASHGSTMVLFLSTGLLEKAEQELMAGGYSADTPAAIVYKATWPDEKVFRCTVSTLARTARENQITKTALIAVGGFLGSEYDRSLLYDPGFSHGCREASK